MSSGNVAENNSVCRSTCNVIRIYTLTEAYPLMRQEEISQEKALLTLGLDLKIKKTTATRALFYA